MFDFKKMLAVAAVGWCASALTSQAAPCTATVDCTLGIQLFGAGVQTFEDTDGDGVLTFAGNYGSFINVTVIANAAMDPVLVEGNTIQVSPDNSPEASSWLAVVA